MAPRYDAYMMLSVITTKLLKWPRKNPFENSAEDLQLERALVGHFACEKLHTL